MSLLSDLAKDLPADRPMALLIFAQRAYKEIVDPPHMVGTDEDHIAVSSFIKRFSQKYSISANLSKVTRQEFESDYDYMKFIVERVLETRPAILAAAVKSEVEELISDYEAKTDVETFGLARLNSEEKKKVHEHINRIRAIIESSDIPDRKKNALFDRLNELASEVDSHGTSTDKFFAFAGDVGFVLGDMTKKAKPLFNEVKEILRLVGRARARQEGISLPPGDEVLQLPAPRDEEE